MDGVVKGNMTGIAGIPFKSFVVCEYARVNVYVKEENLTRLILPNDYYLSMKDKSTPTLIMLH